MQKYLGFDIGKKKIGVAISESGIIAREYGTLEIKSQSQAIEKILEIIKKEKVDFVVVGLPLDGGGKITQKAGEVRELIGKIEKLTVGVKFIFQNEYLTTKEAERILREQGLPLGEIIKRSDSFAAKIILEEYLTGKSK